jgi:hypothetical protein
MNITMKDNLEPRLMMIFDEVIDDADHEDVEDHERSTAGLAHREEPDRGARSRQWAGQGRKLRKKR